MPVEIIVAIINSVAVILSALIGLISFDHKKKKSNNDALFAKVNIIKWDKNIIGDNNSITYILDKIRF